MTSQAQEETVARLKQLVQKHSVCYEVWPESQLVRGEIRKVGFDLQLFGIYQQGEQHPLSPGCPRCVQTFEDLRQIAEWIMPKDERPSRYEIEPYRSAVYETPSRHFRPEVELTMKIIHRHGFDRPVDECEERCLREMEGKLDHLGARRAR